MSALYMREHSFFNKCHITIIQFVRSAGDYKKICHKVNECQKRLHIFVNLNLAYVYCKQKQSKRNPYSSQIGHTQGYEIRIEGAGDCLKKVSHTIYQCSNTGKEKNPLDSCSPSWEYVCAFTGQKKNAYDLKYQQKYKNANRLLSTTITQWYYTCYWFGGQW